jgi:tetratricopeptide (TPR) repeat protein
MESPSLLLSSMRGRLSVWDHWDRWREAREVATSILQTSEQYQQDENWQGSALLTLAELTYRMGEPEESERFLREYRRIFEPHAMRPLLLPGIHTAHEDWPRALADQRELIRRTEPFPSPSAIAHLAETTVLAGEPLEEQQAICERAVKLGEESGARRPLAIALRARGRMYLEQESWSQAEQNLRQALEIFEALDLPWERGETLYCLGQFYLKQARRLTDNDLDEQERKRGLARLFFEQALGFFESLHAVHDARRAREALTALAGEEETEASLIDSK